MMHPPDPFASWLATLPTVGPRPRVVEPLPLGFPSDPPPPPPSPPGRRWAVYRDADGQLIQVNFGQQASLDASIEMLPPGMSITMLDAQHALEAVCRFGFIDVDDPAKPIAYDKAKLDAEGLTLADMHAKKHEGVLGGPEWVRRPIHKPTKAT